MITKVARIAAGLLMLAAIVLTLGPQKIRPYTGIEHGLEHGTAFALVGLAFGLGYPNHRMMLPSGSFPAALISRSTIRAPEDRLAEQCIFYEQSPTPCWSYPFG